MMFSLKYSGYQYGIYNALSALPTWKQQRQTVPSHVPSDLPHPRDASWVTVLLSVFSDIASTSLRRDLACGTTVTQVIHNVNGFTIDNNFIVPTASMLHSTKEAFSVFVTLHGMCESNPMMGSCFCECHLATQANVRCQSEQHRSCNELK